jgi:hypothetical protein
MKNKLTIKRIALSFFIFLVSMVVFPIVAAAHEDFPAQWCGGKDCDYVTAGDIRPVCNGVIVKTEKIKAVFVPYDEIAFALGDSPEAICGRTHTGRLNKCNPKDGAPCDGLMNKLGVLLTPAHIFALMKESAKLCDSPKTKLSVVIYSIPAASTYVNVFGGSVITTPSSVPVPMPIGLLIGAMGILYLFRKKK